VCLCVQVNFVHAQFYLRPTENKTKTSVSVFHLNCQCIFAFALNMLCPNFVNRGAVKQVIAKDVKQRPKILESKTEKQQLNSLLNKSTYINKKRYL
jgi:hypothetical protein